VGTHTPDKWSIAAIPILCAATDKPYPTENTYTGLTNASKHGTAANAQSAGNAKEEASAAPRLTGIVDTTLVVVMAAFVAFAASSADT
jgi:hypothetical protein